MRGQSSWINTLAYQRLGGMILRHVPHGPSAGLQGTKPHLPPAGTHSLQREPIFFPPFMASQLASSLQISYPPAPWTRDAASRKQN